MLGLALPPSLLHSGPPLTVMTESHPPARRTPPAVARTLLFLGETPSGGRDPEEPSEPESSRKTPPAQSFQAFSWVRGTHREARRYMKATCRSGARWPVPLGAHGKAACLRVAGN